MPATHAECIRTKSYVSYGSKKEIVDFEKGKFYPIVNMGSSNVTFVISESGYKEKFSNDYYTYFRDSFTNNPESN